MEKILTISIAAYNAEKDIAICLDSLIATGIIEKLDVVIVNDGSVDQTAEIANSYVKKYVNSIRLINKQNGGHGSTINASIKVAKGKYYKILDSDDWVESLNLKKLVDFLEENDIDMVLNPYHEISYSDHSIRKLVKYEKQNLIYNKKYDISALNDNHVLFMHSLTFKTDIMKKMGSIIDEHCFYVDMEYCVFPMLYIKSFVCLEFPVYQYLLGSQTQSMNMQNMIKRRDQHMKVTKRLISFYYQNEDLFSGNVKNIIRTRIKYAIYQQYKIFFSMTGKEAILEVKDFDSWLKSIDLDFYKGVNGRFMKIINFNRRTNYIFFDFIVKIIKNLNIK